MKNFAERMSFRLFWNEGDFKRSQFEAGLDQIGYETAEDNDELVIPPDSDENGIISYYERQDFFGLDEHVSTEEIKEGMNDN